MRDFSRVKRIVVKVGTNLLSSEEGIDRKRVEDICHQIAELKGMGFQVILVTSGAIGLGAKELGHRNKVVHIPMRQACAAIGQPILMSHYRDAFRKEGILTAQVLLTRNDMNNRKTYNNLRASVATLLSMGVVPIFNENDVVSTAEIGSAFGDNDRMSAMVASKMDAGLLVLLTDIDGLYTGNPKKDPDAHLVTEVDEIDDEVLSWAKGAGSTFSTGGMKTKVLAARIASMASCATVIASGYKEGVLAAIARGEEVGTWFHPHAALTQRQRWIINNSHQGAVVVDEGALEALKKKRSLLPSGVIGVQGVFEEGDVIKVLGPDGTTFGKAVTGFDSTAISRMMGRHSDEVDTLFGVDHGDWSIFRPEDLVVGDETTL